MAHEKCKEVFSLLSEYLDRELDQVSCEGIEAHLAGCPPCIEFFNSLKRTVGLCRGCLPVEAPPTLSPADRDKLVEAYRRAMRAKGL
jgi:predicted anti-sigma-YlaC factor YlaD